MRSVFLTCLTIVLVPGSAKAAEMQVNVRTASDQKNAAVAANAAGDSVIVWASYYSTTGRSYDILARRLDWRGRFLGDEFPVNTATAGNQNEPAAALDDQGRCAIVWQGPGPDQEDIFLRLFDPNGHAVTGELLVNLAVAGRQLYPSVAVGGTGVFVVAWESRETTAAGSRTVARFQLFDPNGSGLGGEVLVDTDSHDCRYPQVAMDGAGRFAVAWMRDRSVHPIVVRLFDAYGVPVTAPLQVNTTSISLVPQPALAMNSLGHFLIAWDGHRADAADVHARCYDPTGVPRGEPFVVNTTRAGARQPRGALSDANEFVVVWQYDTGDPNAGTEIAGRTFDPNGVPTGDQFALNAYTREQQRYPDVAMAGDGSFLTVWESNGQDGSGYGIFASLSPARRPADPNQED